MERNLNNMPVITCSFCDECFGSFTQENWNKAWNHETKKHQRELQKLEAQSHD